MTAAFFGFERFADVWFIMWKKRKIMWKQDMRVAIPQGFRVVFPCSIWQYWVICISFKRKSPDEFQVLPSRVTAGSQRHQKAFLHRICFLLKNPGLKKIRGHITSRIFVQEPSNKNRTKTQTTSLEKITKPWPLSWISGRCRWTHWTPETSRKAGIAQNLQNLIEKTKPFGVRFFRVLRLDSAAPNRSSMAMTPEVWDELIHLREDRQKMLEMGITVGMGESAGVLYIKMGCPKKQMGSHVFLGSFFSFPTLGLVRLWGSFQDHHLWK